jgi:pimeloyl-ACP methyl ester carboxylesterase
VLIPGEKPEPEAKPVEVVVDGGSLVNWLVGMTEVLGPGLPTLLDDMTRGRPHDVLASVAAVFTTHADGDMSWGLQYGVACSEWMPYESADDIISHGRRAFPAFPTSVLAQAPQFPFQADICRVWQVPKAPAAQREATRSAIPTLVIAGSYDASTSPLAAEAAAASLTKSTVVTIPGVGHFTMPKSPCAQRVMASFLAKPNAPDIACVAALKPPPFKVPPQ